MLESAFITQEYHNTDTLTLEKVTSLSVVNTSGQLLIVNDYKLNPRQKVTLVNADGTYSKVVLNIKKFDASNKEKIKILLIYKKLI